MIQDVQITPKMPRQLSWHRAARDIFGGASRNRVSFESVSSLQTVTGNVSGVLVFIDLDRRKNGG
ncbi:hypothetical protein DJICPGNB_08945 [Escherichia coli]|nr:hypothetical protein DJICPGNB_08945 [Escherichia coli]